MTIGQKESAVSFPNGGTDTDSTTQESICGGPEKCSLCAYLKLLALWAEYRKLVAIRRELMLSRYYILFEYIYGPRLAGIMIDRIKRALDW